MTLPESGVRLVIDSSAYDASMRRVIANAGKVDSALDSVVDSANAAERALCGIDGTVSVKTSVDDAELRTARDIHNDIDANTSTTANVDDSKLKGALGILEKLATPITVTIGIGGAAVGLLGGLAGSSGVASIIEMDSALQKLEGTTGRMIPGAEALIVDLYTNAWGDSRTSIAGVVQEASNLRIANDDLEEAVRTAFNVSDTGIGETDEILRTMDTMVKNDLVPDFETAGDVLVTGLQTGANRGDDLLDTFNEYGSTFKELKISGPGALALINSGLDAGIDNSDRIADSMREVGIRLGEIGTNPDIAKAFTQLDNLSDVDLAGMLDAYNAGEISGDEFFAGFFAALADAQAADPAAAQTIAATLVGTIAEDFGTETISQLTTVWDESLGSMEGRAEQASNTINDNLGTAFTGLQRTLEQEFANILENVIDVDSIIDRAKEAVAVFSAELQSGASISEAFSIALEISPESIQQFESIIGNLALSLAGAIATALDVIGQKDAAASLRASIADAAQQQLVFDVKLADDGADIENAMRTASVRGLSPEVIADSLNQAMDEFVAGGDVGKAQQFANFITSQLTPTTEDELNNIIQGIGERGGALVTPDSPLGGLLGITSGEQVDLNEVFNIEEFQAKAAEAGAEARTAFQEALAIDDFATAMGLAEALNDQQLMALVEQLEAARNLTIGNKVQDDLTQVSERTQAMHDETAATLEQNANAMAGWAGRAAANLKKVIDQYTLLAAQAVAAKQAQDLLLGTGGGGGSDHKAAGGDLSAGTTWVGERGPELMTSDGSGSIINAARSQELISAISSIARVPMGGGGNVTNNYINLSQTNHARSSAQASMIGMTTANQVRGFV